MPICPIVIAKTGASGEEGMWRERYCARRVDRSLYRDVLLGGLFGALVTFVDEQTWNKAEKPPS